jgi:hypothetical protein
MTVPFPLSSVSPALPSSGTRPQACIPGSPDAAGRAACERKAFHDFEAMLATKLASDMLATGFDSAPGSEVQKDFFRTTLASAIGNAIAERSGLGVAKSLESAAGAGSAKQIEHAFKIEE